MSKELLSKRKVVLGVTGSVAAYKACDLVRKLKAAGAEVRVLMTANAQRFVGAETLQSLSGNMVLTDLFAAPWERLPAHISLRQWADIILVAPATANIIGKAASGVADDLLSTTILCAIEKVVFAPAMNSAMYDNPVVQENIKKLRRIGCHFVEPESGPLACGAEGPGRLADANVILDKLSEALRSR